MMNDRRQKQAALSYAIGKGWFPQLELVVQRRKSTSLQTYDITDIDVYAAVPDEFSAYRAVIFDCKSSAKASPITRALWAKGLSCQMGASWGICLVSDAKNINLDHRETAGELNMSLMTETEFGQFVTATDGFLEPGLSELSDINKWDSYLSIGKRHPGLQQALDFSSSRFWSLNTAGEQVRNSVALLRAIRGELDPGKKEHMAVFADQLSLFVFAMARISHGLFKAFLQPTTRQELDAILLPYIYGGRGNYQLISQLRTSLARRTDSTTHDEVGFPEWNKFVQLVRSLLDSPVQALHAPLLAREVAWSFFDDRPSLQYAQHLSQTRRQTGKFCLQAAEYLVAAAKLPPEFREELIRVFVSLQSPPAPTHLVQQPELPLDGDSTLLGQE